MLWDGLADGLFTIVSSDHAPFCFDDPHGKKPGGREVAFQHIPNGIPGLETRLPLLFSEGVRRGRITLNQFVALTSTQPARLYGLHPRKGTIAIGADADIAIWDPELEVTIDNRNLHHAVDYTPYEGTQVTGWPVTTLVRGVRVWDGGVFCAPAGHGVFLPCGKPDMARPKDDPAPYLPRRPEALAALARARP